MAQAYPQFSPVQILEAGQRAMADGRTEYATQFFQHLIDHYSNTAEAATAREVLAQSEPAGVTYAATPSQAASRSGSNPVQQNGGQARGAAMNAPVNTNGHVNGAANGHVDGYSNGHANGHSNGYANGGYAANGHANSHANGHEDGFAPTLAMSSARPGPEYPQYAREPSQTPRPAMPAPQAEVRGNGPRYIARNGRAPDQSPSSQPHSNGHARLQAEHGTPAAASHQRLLMPAPEKNYIIGRVISGLLLIIGIMGIFAGIMLVYAAVSDPGIYATVGLPQPGQAMLFAGAVFVGSLVMLIVSQVATAVFDGADAAADIARIERYRAGDTGEDDA